MTRSICFIIAASFVLAGCNLAQAQDTQDSSSKSPTTLAKLQAENTSLKTEVAVQARTIAQLQAQLKAAQQNQQAPAASTETPGAPAIPAQSADASASTNAGPQRALPLDSTNAVANAAAPGAPAEGGAPARSYTVVKGDSLWKIAHKMYPGDAKNGVDKIQEANKDAIGDKPLKIGQVLVIP